MSEITKQSYYRDNLPKLIQKLKDSVENVLDIIDKDIDDEIGDDKLFNVLKAKRQASEDVIWTLKRIDELENELLGIDEKEEEKSLSTNPAKRYAKKQLQ